jgi:hypothetical protein
MSRTFDGATGAQVGDSIPFVEPPIESVEPTAGAYYRHKSGPIFKDGGWNKTLFDDICVVTGIDSSNRVEILSLTTKGTTTLEGFFDRFEWLPDGAEVRARMVNESQTKLLDMGKKFQSFKGNMKQFMPHLDNSGNVSGVAIPALAATEEDNVQDELETDESIDIAQDTSTALVTVASQVIEGTIEVKRATALMRNSVKKFQIRMETERAWLEACLKEQTDAAMIMLQEMTGDINKILRRANEMIHTLNLYLGDGEEIIKIAEGEPAPKSTHHSSESALHGRGMCHCCR